MPPSSDQLISKLLWAATASKWGVTPMYRRGNWLDKFFSPVSSAKGQQFLKTFSFVGAQGGEILPGRWERRMSWSLPKWSNIAEACCLQTEKAWIIFKVTSEQNTHAKPCKQSWKYYSLKNAASLKPVVERHQLARSWLQRQLQHLIFYDPQLTWT